MISIAQDHMRNSILRHLNAEDFEKISRYLVPVDLQLRDVWSEPNQPMMRLLFPEQGFVSVMVGTGRAIEVGLIGPEGFVGTSLLLGTATSPQRYMIQADGYGYALDAAAFPSLRRDLPSLFDVGLLYIQTLLIQAAETVFASGTQTIEPRLARWLLMCHDRLATDEITLTHDLLSVMLGVQRSSVTLALQSVEGERLIKAQRGRIKVLDRAGLLTLAGHGYGAPQAEYNRLIEHRERAAVIAP